MEKTSKLTRILIAAAVLIAAAYALSGLLKTKNTQEIIPEAPASSEEADFSKDGAEEAAPDNAVSEEGEEGGEAPAPAGESTPTERASRTVSPSEAASYSDDDLPPDF